VTGKYSPIFSQTTVCQNQEPTTQFQLVHSEFGYYRFWVKFSEKPLHQCCIADTVAKLTQYAQITDRLIGTRLTNSFTSI